MKRMIGWILLLSVTVLSCRSRTGSGVIVSEQRDTGPFHGLKVSNAIEVEWRRGEQSSVKIEADDNVIGEVKTRVSNGVLRIDLDRARLNHVTLRAYVTSPTLDYIEASSASSVRALDMMTDRDRVDIRTSSAAEVEAGVDAPNVKVDASSSSGVKLHGRTRNLDTEASSAASIHAFGLLSEESRARSSSAATIDLYASVKLDASASSGASVHYKGGATDVRKKESSGGSVEKE